MTDDEIIHLKRIKAICRKYHPVNHYGHNAAWAIRNLFLAGHLKVIEVKNNGGYFREHSLDLNTKESISSAYDDNIHVSLQPDDTVRIVVDESTRSLCSQPSKWSRTFILEGKWWLHKEFVTCVQQSWHQYTSARVEAEIVLANERRRVVIAEQILAGTYVDPLEDE